MTRACKPAFCFCDTPIGTLRIGEDGGGITSLEFVTGLVPLEAISVKGIYLLEAVAQLQEYFTGKRKLFDLPLHPQGTEFQQKVWNQLRAIPYGETRCYQEIALAVGNPRATRAVGMANNRNPIPILIPCHRVVGKDGKLVGYAGGLDKKRYLLELEQKKRN